MDDLRLRELFRPAVSQLLPDAVMETQKRAHGALRDDGMVDQTALIPSLLEQRIDWVLEDPVPGGTIHRFVVPRAALMHRVILASSDAVATTFTARINGGEREVSLSIPAGTSRGSAVVTVPVPANNVLGLTVMATDGTPVTVTAFLLPREEL